MAKEPKPKNIGNLGGPLLGGLSRFVSKAAERPTQAGMDTARDLGDRLQGRAAYRAGRTGNFVMQLLGGRKLPTPRSRAEMIKRGDDWNTSENQLATGRVSSEYEAASRPGGVAAGKAALVEVTGRRGRQAEQAILLLLGSSSWIELQNALIQGGRNQGKRISEVGAWQDVLSHPANAAVWAEVSRRRPDRTPDVLQAAEQALGYRYEDVSGNQRAELDELNIFSMEEAINRFDATILPGLHEGIFREVARLNNLALAHQLYDRLHLIRQAAGHVGQDAIGSLAGPREFAIDAALAPIGESYSSI